MIDQFLKERGYSDWERSTIHGGDTFECFKRVPDTHSHSFLIQKWSLKYRAHAHEVYTLSLTSETEGNLWVKIEFYTLSKIDLIEKLAQLEERLKNCIIPIGADPMDYRWEKNEE